MKNLVLMLLTIGSVMIFFGCQENATLSPVIGQNDEGPDFLAKKPAPNLTGTMILSFNPPPNPPPPNHPVWVGTITFEGIGEFNMRFISLTSPRPYSQASPFKEIFEIYKGADIYMRGHDSGVTTLANNPPDDPSKYRMNGKIEEAEGPFEEWLGRNVHMNGLIHWQEVSTPDGPVVIPKSAPGTFRIN